LGFPRTSLPPSEVYQNVKLLGLRYTKGTVGDLDARIVRVNHYGNISAF
jgi:hypothetical protein